MSDDCHFCLIAEGKKDAAVIYQDEQTIAFLDIHPIFHGHALLIPKKHFPTFYDLPKELVTVLFANAQKIGRAIEKGMNAEGSFLAMNNVVSQSVAHMHMHLVPRKKGDGLKGFFWPRTRYQNPAEMEEVSKRIRATF